MNRLSSGEQYEILESYFNSTMWGCYNYFEEFENELTRKTVDYVILKLFYTMDYEDVTLPCDEVIFDGLKRVGIYFEYKEERC